MATSGCSTRLIWTWSSQTTWPGSPGPTTRWEPGSKPWSKELDVGKNSKIKKELRDVKFEKKSLDLGMLKNTFEREIVKKEEVSIRNQIEMKEMESNRADLQKLANLPTER